MLVATLVLRVTSNGNNQGNGNGNSDSSTTGGSSSMTLYIAIAAGVGGLVLIVLIIAIAMSRRRRVTTRHVVPARADVEFTNPTFMHGYLEPVSRGDSYGQDAHQYAAVTETAVYDNPAGSRSPDDTYQSLRLAPPGMAVAGETDDTVESGSVKYDLATNEPTRPFSGYLDVSAVEDDA